MTKPAAFGSYRAVLLDFDGVVGDTMYVNLRGWKQAFSDLGVEISQHSYFSLEGMAPLEVARTLARSHGLDVDLGEAALRLKEKYFLAAGQCKIYPAVYPLLAALASRRKTSALVTSASRSRLYAVLPTELVSLFGTIVDANSVARCKPAPDPFLQAAEQLSVTPGDCIVVENAPLGIASAKSAGMRCIAVQSTLGAEFLGEADYIFPDLEAASTFLLAD